MTQTQKQILFPLVGKQARATAWSLAEELNACGAHRYGQKLIVNKKANDRIAMLSITQITN